MFPHTAHGVAPYLRVFTACALLAGDMCLPATLHTYFLRWPLDAHFNIHLLRSPTRHEPAAMLASLLVSLLVS